MALIRCPECGREVSDRATACPNCGFPLALDGQSNQDVSIQNLSVVEKASGDDEDKEIVEVNGVKINPKEIYLKMNRHQTNTMKQIRKMTGVSEEKARELLHYGMRFETTENVHNYSTENAEPAPHFNGIYRVSLLGKRTEIYCPRCRSSNCSWYTQEKVIPGKTKTKYTANLNPLKPFTLVNKKEKVIRKEQVIEQKKIMCNSCGYTFY